MELEKVRELVEMMKANDLSELKIVDGETQITLKRSSGQGSPQVIATPMTPMVAMPVDGHSISVSASQSGTQPQEPTNAEEEQHTIVSPIVGTFFSAPSPSAQPFIKVGSEVTADTVVCIVEAMKVMNEIKAGVSGVIKKVLVENGGAVEYNQPLFLVEPG